MTAFARRLVPAIACATAVLATSTALAQVTVTDLGTVHGNESFAYAVNATGDAVGYSSIDPNTSIYHAVRWTIGGIVDLGTLCGSGCPSGSSFAYDINDAGQIVGESDSADGVRGFLWDAGVMTALPPLDGDSQSAAQAINNLGQVVGSSSGPSGYRAVRWLTIDGHWIAEDLGSLGTHYGLRYAFAYDINDAGQIVGWSADGTATSGQTNVCGGFVWQGGTIEPLGVYPNPCIRIASGINASGAIAGNANFGGSHHAATWANGTIRDLGAVTSPGFSTSWQHGINDDGDVSGGSDVNCSFTGVMWTAESAIVLPSLNSLPCSRSNWAYGINNRGLIAGGSATDDGAIHAVLWSTRPPDTTPPVVTGTLDTTRIWPPNGKMIPVTLAGTVFDADSGIANVTYRVTDEYGTIEEAGSVTVGQDGHYTVTISLEARRRGGDTDGRRYTFMIVATDVNGNSGHLEAVAVVAHQ